MRIGMDAKRMLNNGTGLGNHARILANALMRDYPDHEYQLYTPRIEDRYLHELHGSFSLHMPGSKLAQAVPAWWRTYGMTDDLRRNKIDVYHGLSNELPLHIHRTGIPTVVTIHDLIFLKHHEQYPWLDRQIYTIKTQYATRHAHKIIAVSEETKHDLIDFYHVPEKKIEVIYQSIDPRFNARAGSSELAAFRSRHQLPAKYILNVSSFFPRKNQIQLIRAFDSIRDKVTHSLVLAGSAGGMIGEVNKLIEELNLRNRVLLLHEISNDEMPLLYQGADLFVYPALMEGFGMPVLEALVSGVLVIATGSGAIAEAAGPGAVLIDPTQAADIAQQILLVLRDGEQRERMIRDGYTHAATMTDTLFARGVMKVYESVA